MRGSVPEGAGVRAALRTLSNGAITERVVGETGVHIGWFRLAYERPDDPRALARTIVGAVPNGRGLGVFYWDATWTAVPGNGWDPTDPTSGDNWENQALFDFDDDAVPAMRELHR